jgi:hypothetical protein
MVNSRNHSLNIRCNLISILFSQIGDWQIKHIDGKARAQKKLDKHSLACKKLGNKNLSTKDFD